MGTQKKKPTVHILALFDISQSTASMRKEYQKSFQKILEAIQVEEGAEIIVRGARITEETEATASFPLDVTFRAFRGFGDVRVDFEESRKKATKEAEKQLRALLKQEAEGSDIISGFRLAEKVFSDNHATKNILVIFSDMIEQTSEYDFTQDPLKEKDIKALIQKEKERHLLPNLSGVDVWITGFGRVRGGNLSRERRSAIERFWKAYISATGATLKALLPTLLDFDLSG